jgi:ABC-type dipeptide/oligopeptide/nickel transport system ATPase component
MRSMLLEVRDLKTYFFTAAGTVRAVDGVSYNTQSVGWSSIPTTSAVACGSA